MLSPRVRLAHSSSLALVVIAQLKHLSLSSVLLSTGNCVGGSRLLSKYSPTDNLGATIIIPCCCLPLEDFGREEEEGAGYRSNLQENAKICVPSFVCCVCARHT